LARMHHLDYDGESPEFTLKQRNELAIIGERMYSHRKIQFWYNTYDNRRCVDVVKPTNHADIIVPAHEDETDEKFWLARVIGVYHVRAKLPGKPAQVIDFLHVRWFARDPDQTETRRRLPRIGFFDCSKPTERSQAFGFLDPSVVIRGVHILPAFHYGISNDLLRGQSIARVFAELGPLQDYTWYYVGM
jgi:hypothetical protein